MKGFFNFPVTVFKAVRLWVASNILTFRFYCVSFFVYVLLWYFSSYLFTYDLSTIEVFSISQWQFSRLTGSESLETSDQFFLFLFDNHFFSCFGLSTLTWLLDESVLCLISMKTFSTSQWQFSRLSSFESLQTSKLFDLSLFVMFLSVFCFGLLLLIYFCTICQAHFSTSKFTKFFFLC